MLIISQFYESLLALTRLYKYLDILWHHFSSKNPQGIRNPSRMVTCAIIGQRNTLLWRRANAGPKGRQAVNSVQSQLIH